MTFKEYIQKLNESNPESRMAKGPYAKLYPKQYGTTYRMQYNPKSLKEDSPILKKALNPNFGILNQVDQTNLEPAQSFTYLGGHGT